MPRVLEVVKAIRENFNVGSAVMADEFCSVNSPGRHLDFEWVLQGVKLSFEPHIEFKKHVPHAIGLIRTGDTIQYANIILESA